MRTFMLALALVGIAAACGNGGTDEAASPTAPATDGADVSAGSCVEQYSLKTLAKRDYAFDGTVKSIEPATDDGPDRVEFKVRTWYRGADGTTATRRAYAFGAVTSAGGVSHKVGDRLLVAGDDDFVWECGFTQPHDADVAADWSRTFEP